MENKTETVTKTKTREELAKEIKRQERFPTLQILGLPNLAWFVGWPLIIFPIIAAQDLASTVSLYAFMLAACFSLGFVILGSSFFPGKIKFKTKVITATGIFALFLVLVHAFITKDKKPLGSADHWQFAHTQAMHQRS